MENKSLEIGLLMINKLIMEMSQLPPELNELLGVQKLWKATLKARDQLWVLKGVKNERKKSK